MRRRRIVTPIPPKPISISAQVPGSGTGASDDDPSGIATYSQVGAQFGFGMSWTMVLTFPLMTAVQMISARIGRVTGHGIAGNLARNFPAWLGTALVLLLLVANVINIGANLGAMADATALVTGLPRPVFLLAFAIFCATAEVAALLAGEPVPEPHRPSMGCSLKWKPGNRPAWLLASG